MNNETKITAHPIQTLVIGLLIALFGASMGFNGSQILVVSDVKLNTQAVKDLKDSNSEFRMRETADINNLTLLFSKNLDLNRELIELVKVQNELLKSKK